jgi:hypothetical protein
MKRVIVICEGPTEIEFCKDVLYPYFINIGIIIQTPLIKKSGGGIVPWPALKKQIEIHLLQDRAAYVTTIIDYYGIHAQYQFPDWESAHRNPDKNQRMTILEAAMHQSVNNSLNNRFIPYLQLHEFEGLLFNNIEAFTNQIPEGEFVDKDELIKTIENHPNPELINDTPNNAPSYRLKRLIKGYSKIVYGAILAREIGLERIRAKCPRFDNWIIQLEGL